MQVAITARNFTTHSDAPLRLLTQAGLSCQDHSLDRFGVGTSEETMIQTIGNAEALICGLEPVSERVLTSCPKLRYVSRRGIGYDNIDVQACHRLGITVCRTLGAVEGAVAEHVLAYILYFSRRLDLQNRSMHEGHWNRLMAPGAKGRTLGLVGFGGIGKEIARRARPFGMNMLYTCRHPRAEWESEYGVRYADLDALLSQSDYVSVNVPLTEESRGMFNAGRFAAMKSGAVFINIARSPVMVVDDLVSALKSGHLGGAAVDVFPYEPCTDSPLRALDNVLLTPHTASYTQENHVEMNLTASRNLLSMLDGTINPQCLL